MSAAVAPQVIVPPPDRRGWLIAFGVVEILLGGLGFVFSAFTAAMPLILRNAPKPPNLPEQDLGITFVLVGVFYAMLGAIFVGLGIGSIRARNWARIGSLGLAVVWLVGGVVGTLSVALVMPATLRQMPKDPNLPSSFGPVFMFIYIGFFLVFMVALPLAFVLFYSRPSVRYTCQVASGSAPWHAGKALRMVIATWLWISIAGTLFQVLRSRPFIEIFGFLPTGLSARLIYLGLIAAYLAISIGFVRQIRSAWRAGIALSALMMLSGVVSALRTDRFSALSQVAPEIARQGVPNSALWLGTVFGILMQLVLMGLMLYSARYFHETGGVIAEPPTSTNQDQTSIAGEPNADVYNDAQ